MPRNSVIIIILLLIAGGFNHAAYAATSDAAKQAPPASYSFNPAGKPDPFRPFVEKDPVLKKKAEMDAAISIFPLQKVGLDQFNLLGIAGDTGRRLAIVETKDSRGSRFYALKLGTVIGLNNGKVVEIGKDQIVVEEATALRTGKKNRIIKKLRKDEEGIP
ncbi:MAG: pilus assembly protein PilP [Deltaproteobacteria bacterium]|nr:pilus assembly protein PilP [Deltaproteobacteria bacterium]